MPFGIPSREQISHGFNRSTIARKSVLEKKKKKKGVGGGGMGERGVWEITHNKKHPQKTPAVKALNSNGTNR